MSSPTLNPMEPTRGATSATSAAADAAVVGAMLAPDPDGKADLSLDELAKEAGTSVPLLEAIQRAGLLLPHHVDEEGVERFSPLDVTAVRNGLALIEAGLPLAEFLGIAAAADAAISDIAERAVQAFLEFIRDPALGMAGDPTDVSERLLTAYAQMLPATQELVSHHLRRRLMMTVAVRFAEDAAGANPPTT